MEFDPRKQGGDDALPRPCLIGVASRRSNYVVAQRMVDLRLAARGHQWPQSRHQGKGRAAANAPFVQRLAHNPIPCIAQATIDADAPAVERLESFEALWINLGCLDDWSAAAVIRVQTERPLAFEEARYPMLVALVDQRNLAIGSDVFSPASSRRTHRRDEGVLTALPGVAGGLPSSPVTPALPRKGEREWQSKQGAMSTCARSQSGVAS